VAKEQERDKRGTRKGAFQFRDSIYKCIIKLLKENILKILILEDSHARIQTFKQKLKDHDLFFYDQVKDAKAALILLGPFDVIFLDHDLDDKVFVSSEDENTGYQLAKYIAQNELKFDQIILHSMNPAGVLNMKNVLPDAIIAPFPTLF